MQGLQSGTKSQQFDVLPQKPKRSIQRDVAVSSRFRIGTINQPYFDASTTTQIEKKTHVELGMVDPCGSYCLVLDEKIT